jgi:hypothetical protein
VQQTSITDNNLLYDQQEPKRSVRTSTYVIPDQGDVPLTPISQKSTKSFQSFQKVTPKHQARPYLSDNKSSLRSKSFEEQVDEYFYEKPNQDGDFKPDSIKSIAQRFGVVNRNQIAPPPLAPTSPLELKSPISLKKSTFEIQPHNLKPFESKDDLYPISTTKKSYQSQINYNLSQKKPDFRRSSPDLPEKEFLLTKTPTSPGGMSYSYKSEDYESIADSTNTNAPKLLKRLPPVMKKQEGQQAKLEIEISGYPEPQVIWLKDNLHVHNKPDTRITSNFGLHTLIIPEAFREDSGLYKVLVKSPLGTLESFCQLIVEGFKH